MTPNPIGGGEVVIILARMLQPPELTCPRTKSTRACLPSLGAMQPKVRAKVEVRPYSAAKGHSNGGGKGATIHSEI